MRPGFGFLGDFSHSFLALRQNGLILGRRTETNNFDRADMAKVKKTAASSSGGKPSIAACIEAVLSQSDTLIGAVIDGVSNAADRTGVTGGTQAVQSPALLAAIGALVNNREAVSEKFAKRLRALLYAGLGTSGQVRAVTSFQELRLFDEGNQLDDSIEIARAQQEMAISVEKTLPQLDALISGLLGWITVQSQINPLRPEVFIHALRDALKDYVPDEELRGQLIAPAAGRLGVALEKLYRKVIDWLLMHGIEPAGPTLSVNAGAAGSAAAGTVSSTVAKTMLTLDKLRRMLTGESNDQLPSDSLGKRGSGFLHTVPLSLKAIEDGNMMEAMIDRLDQQAVEDPEELARRQEEARQALKDGKNMGKLLGEEVTRVMLDNLLKDERLLPKVRILIKGLEPALIDLAESDGRFFGDEEHPARLYLSQIVDRAVGFTQEHEEGFARFFKSIQDAVGEVIQGHKHLQDKTATTLVFDLALQNLLAVWERTDALVRAQQEAAARALLQAEQRNTEAQRLALEFHQLLDVIKIADSIRDFLTGVWSQVVAKAVVDAGEGAAPDTKGYRALVDDLIWSAQPKAARKDRPRLLAMIPGLLTKLRLGVKSIEYPGERLQVFFDELLHVHEQALEGRPPRQQEALYKPPSENGDSMLGEEALTSSHESEERFYEPGDVRWAQAIAVEERAEEEDDDDDEEERASDFIDLEHQERSLQRLVSEAGQAAANVAADGAEPAATPEQDQEHEAETGELPPAPASTKASMRTAPAPEIEDASPLEALRLQIGVWIELKIKGQWTRAQLTWQSPRKTMFVFVSGSGTAHSMSNSSLENMMREGKVRLVSDKRVLDSAIDAAASSALRNAVQNAQNR